MKLFLSCLVVLTISCSLCTAQTCNNWLNTPFTSSSVNIGGLDVSGNQITVEATFYQWWNAWRPDNSQFANLHLYPVLHHLKFR